MKRGWIITLIVLFILLLGGGAFLLLRYQRKINDREADLETLNTELENSAKIAQEYEKIAASLRSGEITADQAAAKMDAVDAGEDPDKAGTNPNADKTARVAKGGLGNDKLSAAAELKSALQAKNGTKIIANGPKINLNDLK